MKQKLVGIAATILVLAGCGQGKKNRKDIIHAPDELLVQAPLNLAGTNPEGRDASTFNQCLTGNGNPNVLANCHLPYLTLGEGSREEQVAAILSNTLVSHPWQVDQFKNFLQGTRPEIISMLSCVKGIAISGDIRPSFYYPPSGGIYLDAGNFVLTKEEGGTVSNSPDAREQNFEQVPLLFFTVDTLHEQTQEEAVRLELTRLLSHELAHACDFKAYEETGKFLSDALPDAPKNAIYYMAQWLYFGDASAKAEFSKYTAEQIGKSFEDGPIVDIYGYGNQYENLAMVIQDQLAFEFNGNNRTDLLTDNPKANQKLRDFPIHWGMKGKFCQPELFAMGRAITAKAVPMKMEFQKAQTDCITEVFTAGIPVYQALGLEP